MHLLLLTKTFYFLMLGLITVKSLRPSCKIISSQRSTSALRMAANIEKLPKNVLVTVADGIEEIETVTIVDTLVRSGATVVVASVSNSLQVTCSRGVKLVADRLIGECIANEWDLICLPGGMPGAEHLRDSKDLQKLLIKQNTDKKLISAICAAPAIVLAPLGILTGKRATCYPAKKFRDVLQLEFTSSDAVTVDDNLITSQGPGTSLKFSLALVGLLYGIEAKEKLSIEMCADV